MLPYDGMTRTGSKGVSHSAIAETPSEARKLLEKDGAGKQPWQRHGNLQVAMCSHTVRTVAHSFNHKGRSYMRQFGWAAALLMSAALAGCGGSSAGDQSPRVSYTALVSFGDSLSDVGSYKVGAVAAAGGGQFTINGGGKNWTELLAAQLGLPAPCAALTGGFGVASAVQATCTNYAEGGARVTDPIGVGYNTTTPIAGPMTVPVVSQIADHLSRVGGNFSGRELVTVLAGANDIFTQMGMVGAGAITPASGVANVTTAASDLATLVNTQLLGKGAAHVVVANVPDINGTPYAATLSATARPLLTSMIQTYNSTLQTALAGNSKVLLVDIYTVNQDQLANPAPYGLSNVTTPACDLTVPIQAAPPSGFGQTALVCNTTNLIPGDTSHYLFADGVHPTPYGYWLLTRLVAKEMIIKGWL